MEKKPEEDDDDAGFQELSKMDFKKGMN